MEPDGSSSIAGSCAARTDSTSRPTAPVYVDEVCPNALVSSCRLPDTQRISLLNSCGCPLQGNTYSGSSCEHSTSHSWTSPEDLGHAHQPSSVHLQQQACSAQQQWWLHSRGMRPAEMSYSRVRSINAMDCVLQVYALQQAQDQLQATFSSFAADQQDLVAQLHVTNHLWSTTMHDNQLLTARLRELQAQVPISPLFCLFCVSCLTGNQHALSLWSLLCCCHMMHLAYSLSLRQQASLSPPLSLSLSCCLADCPHLPVSCQHTDGRHAHTSKSQIFSKRVGSRQQCAGCVTQPRAARLPASPKSTAAAGSVCPVCRPTCRQCSSSSGTHCPVSAWPPSAPGFPLL